MRVAKKGKLSLGERVMDIGSLIIACQDTSSTAQSHETIDEKIYKSLMAHVIAIMKSSAEKVARFEILFYFGDNLFNWIATPSAAF